MAITPQQRLDRRNHVGGSDCWAIVSGEGLWNLWAEKTNKLEPEKDQHNGAMEDGVMFESAIIDWAGKTLGEIITDPAKLEVRCESLPMIVTHPDGLVLASGEPVEAKTSGMRGPLMAGWGEPGTDEIPERYLIQATVHIMATKAPVCHVPAYLGGRGPCMFTVKANKDLIDIIATRVDEFWTKCVKADTPPANSVPSLDVVRRVIRVPKKTIPMTPALAVEIATYEAQNRMAKSETMKADELKAKIIAALGDAEATEDGRVTYYSSERKAYTVKESTVRTLRIKEVR